jgi:CDP-diacylglycerol pyrophosphatase
MRMIVPMLPHVRPNSIAWSSRGACLALLLFLGGNLASAQLTSAQAFSRDRLRDIAQHECLPHWLQAHDPSPCSRVIVNGSGAQAQGVVVLADRKGGAHFLLIPTRTIVGIESPELRSPQAPNYFDAAWKSRDVLAAAVGHEVPRAMVGLAVNQRSARSQDQLHIHISCLRRSVYETLAGEANHINRTWSPIDIEGWHYQVLRISGRELAAANPVELLAAGLPGAPDAMEQFTLLVAGMEFKEGPGFAMLAGSSVPGAELLLDASCAVAG